MDEKRPWKTPGDTCGIFFSGGSLPVPQGVSDALPNVNTPYGASPARMASTRARIGSGRVTISGQVLW